MAKSAPTPAALLGAAVRRALQRSSPEMNAFLRATSIVLRSAPAAVPVIGVKSMARLFGDDCTLVFTLGGMAELADGDVVWSSDEDPKWRDSHPDELLGESDAEEVLTYLCDAGFIDEDELGDVTVEVDSADYEDVSETE